jgi:hypothetical protein
MDKDGCFVCGLATALGIYALMFATYFVWKMSA